MVKGTVVIYNTDKKEYVVYPLDIIEAQDAELQAVLTGETNFQIEAYVTEDGYKAIRFRKATVPTN